MQKEFRLGTLDLSSLEGGMLVLNSTALSSLEGGFWRIGTRIPKKRSHAGTGGVLLGFGDPHHPTDSLDCSLTLPSLSYHVICLRF